MCDSKQFCTAAANICGKYKIYRAIQEKSAIFWEITVYVILRNFVQRRLVFVVIQNIQGDSGEICNTLGNYSMCDSKQFCTAAANICGKYKIYRVIQEKSAILWEIIVCVILSNFVQRRLVFVVNTKIYSIVQVDSAILWEMIVCVILSNFVQRRLVFVVNTKYTG